MRNDELPGKADHFTPDCDALLYLGWGDVQTGCIDQCGSGFAAHGVMNCAGMGNRVLELIVLGPLSAPNLPGCPLSGWP